ncbi:sterile alpha motif domain-containing protein 9-like [Varanus komodoensis]|uniref:sterile alpha motif domain-containing protein 9-like n=1 Tax=Varanus komodoensis TaxID=61221 RepID=UPI001CF7A61A|nr:sterile alpha motif domain-containing protein 9-like [Varanus komodoensis]
MDYKELRLNEWNEGHVKCWLDSIGIKKEYVEKLCEEEVTGSTLEVLDEPFLKGMGMKQGQIHILMHKRNKLLQQNIGIHFTEAVNDTKAVNEVKAASVSDTNNTNSEKGSPKLGELDSPTQVKRTMLEETKQKQSAVQPIALPHGTSKVQGSNETDRIHTTSTFDETDSAPNTVILGDQVRLSPFRPFKSDSINFKYVRNAVLSPETGVINLISPCHEYKSFEGAAGLDRQRLQAKLACEVIKFASACLNVRTNGTIHFGIMDSVEKKGRKHGQIVGIPIRERDWYVDALDYIEKCFDRDHQGAARLCIHPPVFIELIQKDSHEQYFVVEIDIEASSNTVKGKLFQVRLPHFNEKSNKVNLDKDKVAFQRVGSKSEPVKNENLVAFIQNLGERDAWREKQESSNHENQIDEPQNLGRKLSVLLAADRNYIDNSLWYILVTNKCREEDLDSIDFLKDLNIFCVFDFDEDSCVSGLCSKYREHHAINCYFLKEYSERKTETGNERFWIFCNGRSDFQGDKNICDENTWIRTKKKYLKKTVSYICDEVLPRGSFLVLFLLLSPVEKPIVDTFHEFYSELNGTQFIICLAESRENYEKWANLAQASCSFETLEQISIVGMKLSHVDATIRKMLPSTTNCKHLPVSTKGLCMLPTLKEEKMSSLEILFADQCDEMKDISLNQREIREIDEAFHRGKKVSWKNFWLADKKKCGELIEREACKKVSGMLNDCVQGNGFRYPVAKVKVFHQPGSGGSTVARQVLWKQRKDFRCAVIRTTYPVAIVCQHAVEFRHYDEKDLRVSLPVLLLVEDYDEEYLDELSSSLTGAMVPKKRHPHRPSFILLCCKRSNFPEKLCRTSPQNTVAVIHKLTDDEKSMFRTKLEKYENQKDFKFEYILTFVLMSKEFERKYVKEFVEHFLKDIDSFSRETTLMRYVALLNFYVHDSYISLSHCEAFLGLKIYGDDKKRQYGFISHLSEQARLIFTELRETTSYISSIQIIHYLVAGEILNQLSRGQPQSEIAMELLKEQVLLQHRFGQEEFLKFIRNLFIRRDKRSRGDDTDSLFSPFIEHILETESSGKAIEVLKCAYYYLEKNAFLAQLLARIQCVEGHENFEEAQHWAEKAKSRLPNDSFILDTEGQVYKKWFCSRVKKKSDEDTPEVIIPIIELALKAIKCFKAAQQAARSEKESMNNSGYFGEVDVGCQLLKLLSTLHVFSKNAKGEHPELSLYLLTDYIPEDIRKPWANLHSRLKGLHQNIYNALDWISEDLSYFQTEKSQSDDENEREEEKKSEKKKRQRRREEQVNNPRRWLKRQCNEFATYFCSEILTEEKDVKFKNLHLIKQMNIYKYGGGNVTTILSFLSDKNDKKSVQTLEKIISCYSEDPQKESWEEIDLTNYILCHFTLACLSPGSPKLLDLPALRECSKGFVKKRKTSLPASTYFLLTLLYWPDAALDKDANSRKNDILTSALAKLKHLHDTKIKDVPPRKKRIYTIFFLGKGYGLRKIVPRAKIDEFLKGSLNERRSAWQNGEVWKIGEVHNLLERVNGWAEGGKIFASGHSEKIPILPLHFDSVPPGNENVKFYLGFTFNGLVAHDIQVNM